MALFLPVLMGSVIVCFGRGNIRELSLQAPREVDEERCRFSHMI